MKNARKIVVCIAVLAMALALCFALSSCATDKTVQPDFLLASESADGYATVYMPSDGDIKIMVLSDPQVDVYEKYKTVGSLGNDATYSFVEDFVRTTSPDLVVINGDLVMNDMPLLSSASYFKRYAEIFERLKTPWAFTFGNHDLDGKYQIDDSATMDSPRFQCSKKELINYFNQNYKYCLINADSACQDGDGNYFVNIRKRSGELVYTLCLFDCLYDEENGEYMHVPSANQVKWYRDTINSISDGEYGTERGDRVVPSMIFNHVGIPEFKTAWNEAYNGGNVTENYHYGTYFDGNYSGEYGDMPKDEQIFSVAKELGSTTAIFMCHHHDNDFSVDYQGIRLTFGQHSGYSHNYRTTHKTNGMTPYDYKAWSGISFARIDDYGDERGGTQIVITQQAGFDVAPVYAKYVLANYAEKYYIDYDAVARLIDESPDYDGTVERGEGRLWKLD